MQAQINTRKGGDIMAKTVSKTIRKNGMTVRTTARISKTGRVTGTYCIRGKGIHKHGRI